MKRHRHTLVAVAAAVAAVLAGAALLARGGPAPSFEKPASAPKAHPALAVVAETPQHHELPTRLPAHGSIAAWQEAIVGSESSGLRLAAVHVDVGQVVRRGQVLATFDADTVQAELAQVDAALAEAQAAADDAAQHAARVRHVQDSGAMSEQQMQQLLTAEKTARARADAQRAAQRALRLRLEHTRVLAPDDGVVSSRTVGAVVPAGTELFRLVRGGRLEWRAELTSAELVRVAPGAVARLVAADGSTVEGRVRMVAPTLDARTRLGYAYVDIPATAALKAGMFASGEFELGRAAALTVPQASLVMRDGFARLYALQPDGRVRELTLRTGRRIDDRVEVLEGLQPGTRFVRDGASFLDDGDYVKEVAATSATPANPLL